MSPFSFTTKRKHNNNSIKFSGEYTNSWVCLESTPLATNGPVHKNRKKTMNASGSVIELEQGAHLCTKQLSLHTNTTSTTG